MRCSAGCWPHDGRFRQAECPAAEASRRSRAPEYGLPSMLRKTFARRRGLLGHNSPEQGRILYKIAHIRSARLRQVRTILTINRAILLGGTGILPTGPVTDRFRTRATSSRADQGPHPTTVMPWAQVSRIAIRCSKRPLRAAMQAVNRKLGQHGWRWTC